MDQWKPCLDGHGNEGNELDLAGLVCNKLGDETASILERIYVTNLGGKIGNSEEVAGRDL